MPPALIPGGHVGQSKVAVKWLPDAQTGALKGIMERGADGHRVFLPGTACNAVKNGACFSLHGRHRQTTYPAPVHECCTSISRAAVKRQITSPAAVERFPCHTGSHG